MKRVLITTFIVLAIDQILKIWVKTTMFHGQEINLLGDWLVLDFVENPGMAFGMQLPGSWGKIILSVFRIGAVIAIAFYIRHLVRKEVHKGLLTAIAFIFAGAMGNIIDSAFYGLIFSQSVHEVATFMPAEGGYAPFLLGDVVDMLKVKYFPAVFNLADFSITLGVILIIIRQRVFFPKHAPQDAEVLEVKNADVDLANLAAASVAAESFDTAPESQVALEPEAVKPSAEAQEPAEENSVVEETEASESPVEAVPADESVSEPTTDESSEDSEAKEGQNPA